MTTLWTRLKLTSFNMIETYTNWAPYYITYGLEDQYKDKCLKIEVERNERLLGSI